MIENRVADRFTHVMLAAFLFIALSAVADGTDLKPGLRFRFERNGPLFVPVEAIGASRTFILDTGASPCMLDTRFRSKLTIAGKVKMRTAAGTIPLRTYSQPDLTISGVTLEARSDAVLIGMLPFCEATGKTVDGVVGLSVLQDHVLRISAAERQFELLNSVPSDPGTEIPVTWPKGDGLNANLLFSEKHQERCLVDSGSMSEVTLRADLFDFLYDVGSITRIREIVVQTANGPARKKEGILDDVALGSWQHSGVVVNRGTTFSYVGLKYLNRYTVTFDFPGRRLFLKPGKYFAEKSRRTCLGVGIYWRDENVRLKYVIVGSPAAQAGLEADDIIESVNGKPVDASSLFKLRRLFENDGETVSLSVRRGDRVTSVKIKLVDF